MAYALDLIGRQFGRLRVIAKANSRRTESGQIKTYWICQCECGKTCFVQQTHLIRTDSSPTRSCGCLRKNISSDIARDLAGKKFGRLTVLYRAGYLSGRIAWYCQCDCGNRIRVRSHCLHGRLVYSCGCLKDELNVVDITGVRIASLVVLERVGSNGRASVWLCKCDCGKSIVLASNRIHNRKSCGCDTRRRQRIAGASRFDDLTGRSFFRLSVIRKVEKPAHVKNRHRGVYWECVCSCGNCISVMGSWLKSGNTKSCGCLKRETLAILIARRRNRSARRRNDCPLRSLTASP